MHKVEYKYGATGSQVNHKYPTILYSWLLCTVKKPVLPDGCMRYASLSALLFPPYKKLAEKLGRKSSWIMNNLLDILVCSIA